MSETKHDIYSIDHGDLEHSLRYIHITSRNVVGMLNRVASLMRRNRYNMEEVSVSFDDEKKAHIIVAVDGRLIDVQHAIEQLRKLHDVFEVVDVTGDADRLFMAFYVEVDKEAEFKKFSIEPGRIVELDGKVKGVFIVPLADTASFIRFLREGDYHYRRRIMTLI